MEERSTIGMQIQVASSVLVRQHREEEEEEEEEGVSSESLKCFAKLTTAYPSSKTELNSALIYAKIQITLLQIKNVFIQSCE